MAAAAGARLATQWLSIGVAVTAAAYATYAGVTWLRFGRALRSTAEGEDRLLDRFMPVYDVAERHRCRVDASAEIAFTSACETDLLKPPIVRAIVRAREVILGSEPDTTMRPRGLLALTQSIGWGVLAEVPGREVVMGAVTQPWEANVIFRGLPPNEFATFNEPGYVKIAWTLRADPVSPTESIFLTETRTVTTDPSARARFRRYWSFLSPGVIVIRWMTLRAVKTEAERRGHALPGERVA